MGCGTTCMKIILVIINVVFLLAGLLMLVFGIVAKANAQAIKNLFSGVAKYDELGVNVSGIINSNSTFMIVIGVIVLVIAIFGFVGACCMVRWMLVVYAIILIVVFLAQIALVIFAAVRSDLLKKGAQEAMYTSLKEGYRKGAYYNGSQIVVATGAVELAWDAAQYKETCCGAYGYADYSNFTEWIPSAQPNSKVPLTCCKKSSNAPEEDPTSLSNFEGATQCLNGEMAYINTENCYDALDDKIQDALEKSKWIAIGIAIAICIIQLLLIIFSFCLCARAGDDKYV